MPKFYIFSDCHGYYNELRAALDEAGFDESDENSWLVSLGDEMDRGPDPEKVIDYLMGLPRAIWVKGNHQELMEELIQRKYPCKYDWSNGTMGSVIDLAPNTKTANKAYDIAYNKVKPFFDKAINYLELENYILIHSFIPLRNHDNLYFEYNPDWRNAGDKEWNLARWGNPFDLAIDGLNQTGKTLIFGHYHCSYPRSIFDDKPEFGDDADFSIYYGNGYIGIDSCCVYTHKINILKIEDDFISGKST